MNTFGDAYGGCDPIKFWSKVDYILILISILSFYNIGFIAALISGILDLFLISLLKKSFTKYNIKARYDIVESAGKQILFLSSYSFLLGVAIYYFSDNHSNILLSIMAILIIIHISVRLLFNKEIIDSTMHWKMHDEETIFKDYISMEKYIFDQYDGVGPMYAMRNDKYEIEKGIIKYKGNEYDKYKVYKYLIDTDQKMEDVANDELLQYIKQ